MTRTAHTTTITIMKKNNTGGAGHGPESDILTKAFLRKYIFYAKSRVQPKVRAYAYMDTGQACRHACMCVDICGWMDG